MCSFSQPRPLLDKKDNNETHTTAIHTVTECGHLTRPVAEQSGTGSTTTSLTVRKLQTGLSFPSEPTQ